MESDGVVVDVDPTVVVEVEGMVVAVVDVDEAAVVVVDEVIFFAGLLESRTTSPMTTPTTTSPLRMRRACFIRFARRCSWASLT